MDPLDNTSDAADNNHVEEDEYAYEAMERQKYLTPLPLPPSHTNPSDAYNIGNGNCLIPQMAGKLTVHHNIEVRVTDTAALTCYVEAFGGDLQDKLYIAAIDTTQLVPNTISLKKYLKIFLQTNPGIWRVCICPTSRMLIVSHPIEDYKLYTCALPETTCGGWILAFNRDSGHLRLFDCVRTTQTHWRFPTLLKE